ncbi:hypothetical protein ACIPPS_27105 [Streptomyces sp. NPDC090127]|uniref:hypothetical protein n=1 Tax=Streptomyces sp. NPDC090127 TaxID=3365953 RepID=UPI00380ACEF6
MLRHAIAPLRRYTQASHDIVRHPCLTSDAKLLVTYVQGLTDAACAKSLGELAADLGLKPRAYQKAKQCLAAAGYYHEWKWQTERGRWVTEQLLANVILTREEAEAARADGSPSPGDPTVGGSRSRRVGRSEPVEEDREKNLPHPPPEEPARDAEREATPCAAPEPDETVAPKTVAPETVPDAQPGTTPDARPEAAPDVAPEAVPDAQPGTTPDARPEAVPDAAPEAVPEAPPALAPEAPPALASDAPPAVAPEVAAAERLLLSLRRSHPVLSLGVREARGLAEAAAEWFRRGLSAAELRQALTTGLPREGIRSAVGFLRHRLVVKLPAPLPPEPPAPVTAAPAALVICDGPGDDHVFRPVADETRCRRCRTHEAQLQAEARDRARQAPSHGPHQPPSRPPRAPWRTLVEEAAAAAPSDGGRVPPS